MYGDKCVYVCPYIHILDTRLYASIQICKDTHFYECMYLCIYVGTDTYVCTYIHIIYSMQKTFM